MSRLPIIVSIVLFALSCCLPCLVFHRSGGGDEVEWGANLAAVGWSGIFAAIWGWFANPFWLMGVVLGLLRKPAWGAALAVVAIPIAFTTFSLFGRQIPGDEGDVTHLQLVRLMPGFYVWIASLCVLPLQVFFRHPK